MSGVDGQERTESVDLPLELIERLARSNIVPLEAKLQALTAWRAELAADSSNPRAPDLMEWLYVAAIFVTEAASPARATRLRQKASPAAPAARTSSQQPLIPAHAHPADR